MSSLYSQAHDVHTRVLVCPFFLIVHVRLGRTTYPGKIEGIQHIRSMHSKKKNSRTQCRMLPWYWMWNSMMKNTGLICVCLPWPLSPLD